MIVTAMYLYCVGKFGFPFSWWFGFLAVLIDCSIVGSFDGEGKLININVKK